MYNGWSNQETWNANLWTDGDFNNDAEMIISESDNKAEALENLETVIRDRFESMVDDSGIENGFLSDVLRTALDRIDFGEIADAYVSELWDERHAIIDAEMEFECNEN